MKKLRTFLLLLLAFMGFNALAISAPIISSCTRPSSTSVKVMWSGVSGASYYAVYRGYSTSPSSALNLGTTTSLTWTDSQAGADTCYYWVEAWDASGAHARSGMATASSGSGGDGDSSGGDFTISATTSTNGCTITWSAQSGATGYRVVRGTTSNMDNASILAETVTGTSYTDTTGTAGKTYYYWIVAKKSSGYVTSSYVKCYKASPPYTVKFNANGGTGTMADETFTMGTAKALTNNAFTRTGYTFLGWSLSAKATKATYTDGQSVTDLTTTVGDVVTLYAVWQGNPYTVEFHANDGSGRTVGVCFVYGKEQVLSDRILTRTGYTLLGWARIAVGCVRYKTGQSITDLTTISGDTVHLYAVWQVNDYTIVFDKNGGTGTMANLAMKYDTAKALTANSFLRVNYQFIGWSTSARATIATYTDKQSVKNLMATPDGSVTLYAVWKIVREVTSVGTCPRYPWNGLVDIDVTFRAAGLSVVSFEVKDTAGNTNLNARTFYVGNPEKNVRTLEVQPGKHRFVWDAAADLGVVERIPFAVTVKVQEKFFNVNVSGGTGAGTFVQGTSVSLSAAAKTGYTFTSWTGSTADVGQLASATSANTTLTVPARDSEYTATYTPNTYTVKFNANGGTGTMAYESFTYDTAKTLPANAFTRDDWTFMGWAESADATTAEYTDKQSVKNLTTVGTKNLYAVWEPVGVKLWAFGPYWATCNIGAAKPEECGYYFWWGDTVGYKYINSRWNAVDGSKNGFSFSTNNCPTYGQSDETLKTQGYIDDSGNLVAWHDAATRHLGARWRMPTSAEWKTLISDCATSWTTNNGVYGLLVTGRGSYASNSIFLPAASFARDSQLHRSLSDAGDYWSSTPNYSYRAWFLFFCSDSLSLASEYYYRYYGMPVRPVRRFDQ